MCVIGRSSKSSTQQTLQDCAFRTGGVSRPMSRAEIYISPINISPGEEAGADTQLSSSFRREKPARHIHEAGEDERYLGV